MLKNIFAVGFAVLLAACGQDQSSGAVVSSEQLAETEMAASAAEAVLTGQFEGRSDHVTTGGVSIRQGEDGFYVVLAEDFSLDGAPDPKLGFGNPDYLIDTQFSALRNKTGAQSYKLPDGFDPTEYETIYVWCEKFSVPLGVATLN